MDKRKQIFTFTLAPMFAEALLRAVDLENSKSHDGVSVSSYVRRVVSEHLEGLGPIDDKTLEMFETKS